jgi:VanZ family protein
VGLTDEPLGFYLDLSAGVAFVALAVLVVRVRPRRPLNLAFAVYVLGLAFATFGANLVNAFNGPSQLMGELFAAGVGVAGMALAAVAAWLDRTVSHRPPMRLRPILLAAFVLYVVYWIGLWFVLGALSGPLGPIVRYEAFSLLYFVSYVGVWVLLTFVLLGTRRQAWRMPAKVAVLLTLGIATWPGFAAGVAFGANASVNGAGAALLELLWVLPFLLVGSGWIASTPSLGRPALVAGLGLFVAPALGTLSTLAPAGTGLEEFFFDGLYGVVTLTGLALLAYALLRHQMFDLDIRLKRGLKGSTVAAVFVAVFFAVSEAAQAFFESRTGSTGLGIGAAALLVFAIAPLQRLGDRVADRALPNVQPADPNYVLRKKRETYRNAYEAAWADGHLTPKDARLLAEIKVALGLPDKEYAAIERAWAADAPKS